MYVRFDIQLTIGNRFKKKHLLVSESYCRIAIVLFIYVSYTNKICLYQITIWFQENPYSKNSTVISRNFVLIGHALNYLYNGIKIHFNPIKFELKIILIYLCHSFKYFFKYTNEKGTLS